MTETLTLEAAARSFREQRDRANVLHARQQRNEERNRHVEEGRSFMADLLVSLVEVTDAPPPAVDLAEPEWDGDERIVFVIDGIRLEYHPRRYMGIDYPYSAQYLSLLRPCQGCGAGEAPVGRDVRSFYELGEALDAPLPDRCEGCWEEQGEPTPLAPPSTPASRLIEALEHFVDARVPQQLP